MLTYEYVITALRSQRHLDRADMALAYSGDQQVLNAVEGVHGEPRRYMVPEEGTLLWVDCLSVPSNSPNRALAYRFPDFLSRPEIAALNAEDPASPRRMPQPGAAAGGRARMRPSTRQRRFWPAARSTRSGRWRARRPGGASSAH